jgi:hypothetical protein
MKRWMMFLLLLFLAACEPSTSSPIDIEEPIVPSEPTASDVDSTEEPVAEIVDEEPVVIDYELGVLSSMAVEPVWLAAMSQDVFVTESATTLTKLNFQLILVLYQEDETEVLDEFDLLPLPEGELGQTLYQETSLLYLNVGDVSNLQTYLEQLPRDLMEQPRSLELSVVTEEMAPSLSLLSLDLLENETVGVLTGTARAGTKLDLFSSLDHIVYNDYSDLLAANHKFNLVIHEADNDLGFSANRYGLSLAKGEITSTTLDTGQRFVFLKFSDDRRPEINFLTPALFIVEGSGSFSEFLKLANPSYKLQYDPLLGQTSSNNGEVMDGSPPTESTPDETISVSVGNEVCKLQQTNPQGHYDVIGFPIRTMIPHKGNIDVAIIPVDFSNAPGDPDLFTRISGDIPEMTPWSEFFSGGQMVYTVHTTNQWIRAPRDAEWYRSRNGGPPDGWQGRDDRVFYRLQSQEEAVTQLIAASDAMIDWSIIDVAIFIFPIEANEFGSHLYMHMGTFQSPSQGQVRFPVWGESFYELQQNLGNEPVTYWDWSIHEILHWQGLIGHGPINSSDYSIMANQYSSSAGIHAWEAFILDWWSSDDFSCIPADEITEPTTISLASIDRLGASPGLKSVMIPLNQKEIIVIEYRSDGEFSELRRELHGIIMYYINMDGENVRCDSCDQIEIEKQNFWRFLRNEEILRCSGGPQGVCGYPSIVQKPGYKLDFDFLSFEIINANTIQITNTNFS